MMDGRYQPKQLTIGTGEVTKNWIFATLEGTMQNYQIVYLGSTEGVSEKCKLQKGRKIVPRRAMGKWSATLNVGQRYGIV